MEVGRYGSRYAGRGLSIKYVTLFLANFDPPSPYHTLSHIPGPPKSMSHISDPPIFSKPSTKNPDKSPLYKFSHLFAGFCWGGFVRGSFVWKILSGVVLSIPPSVRIHLLLQKVKHHCPVI